MTDDAVVDGEVRPPGAAEAVLLQHLGNGLEGVIKGLEWQVNLPLGKRVQLMASISLLNQQFSAGQNNEDKSDLLEGSQQRFDDLQ